MVVTTSVCAFSLAFTSSFNLILHINSLFFSMNKKRRGFEIDLYIVDTSHGGSDDDEANGTFRIVKKVQ